MNKKNNSFEKYIMILKIVELGIFLYLFMFSLDLMGTSLKMFGKEFATMLIQTTTNPFVGLFIGVLATSLIQSSSSTTAIVVGMVGGGVMNVANAIPIIMGANIGTSVTNTIASLPQMNRSEEFKRAFAAATVHDFFNVLAVLVLLPLQLTTNFLGISANYLGVQFQHVGGLEFLSPVKAITKPLVTIMTDFIGVHPWLLLIIALAILLFSLKKMVDVLKVLVVSRAHAWFDRYLFKTTIRAFFVGLLLTVLVQSSSITTSLAVPLAGAGLLNLRQIFPYTLGANIGTTITAMLAALVTQNLSAIIVAFSHLLFNISGIIVWWPFKFIPLRIAELFAKLSAKSKFIPILYILIVFFIIPIVTIYIFK